MSKASASVLIVVNFLLQLEDVIWASSMENKRYPIVVFNTTAISHNSSSITPVGARYHLTFKVNKSILHAYSSYYFPFHSNSFSIYFFNTNFNFPTDHFIVPTDHFIVPADHFIVLNDHFIVQTDYFIVQAEFQA